MVDVQQRALRPLGQYHLPPPQRFVDQQWPVGQVRGQPRREPQPLGHGRFSIKRCLAIAAHQRLVAGGHVQPQRLGQPAGVGQQFGAQPLAPRLVGVGGTDATHRRPDGLLAAGALVGAIQRNVGRGDEVRAAAQLQARRPDVHAARRQRVHLAQQHRRVDDRAIADEADNTRVDDS